jgi:hypothetical protein
MGCSILWFNKHGVRLRLGGKGNRIVKNRRLRNMSIDIILTDIASHIPYISGQQALVCPALRQIGNFKCSSAESRARTGCNI